MLHVNYRCVPHVLNYVVTFGDVFSTYEYIYPLVITCRKCEIHVLFFFSVRAVNGACKKQKGKSTKAVHLVNSHMHASALKIYFCSP